MAIQRVYQVRLLNELHEGSADPELMQELCSSTDFALWATKVTAQALGQTMSTLVVQERHLWLNLAETWKAEKVCFLNAPISQVALFNKTVEDLEQQFSAVKKQTEAISHILPLCGSATRSPRPQPQPAHSRGWSTAKVAPSLATKESGLAARP